MEDTGEQTNEQQQPRTNWRRLIVALLIGILPTALCFFFDWWWPGTICLLLTLFYACSAFDPRLYPFVFTLYALFALSWLSGSFVEGLFGLSLEAAPWWRIVFPIISGIFPVIVLTVLFWLAVLFVSTKWVMDIPETLDGISFWQAFRFVAARTFGFSQPYVLVENGKLAEEKPKGLLAKFGGPGKLVVRSGNAVVLERGSKITRVLGPGVYELKKGEYFKQPTEAKGIFDLRRSGGKDVAEDVLTKDGVPLHFVCSTGFQIEPASETEKRPASRFEGGEATTEIIGGPQYPVYEATILKAVYNTPDGGWTSMFPGGAINRLRDVVAAYTFDQIFPSAPVSDPDPDPDTRVIKQIEDKVNAQINASGAGVLYRGLDIRGISMSDEVRKQMHERWAAPIQRDLKVIEAEAERDALIVRSEGRARSMERLDSSRLAASDRMVPIIEKLANVLWSKMENERIAYGFLSVVQELASRLGDDEYADRQLLRAWRRFARDPYRQARVLEPPPPLAISGEVVSVEAEGDVEPGEGES